MKESSFKLDVVQKVPLVVNKRMSQGEKVKDTKRRKCQDGPLNERPDIAVEEDTEEMKRWRSLNQSEMDLCWKNLAERMEEEVLSKKARKEPSKAEGTYWNG